MSSVSPESGANLPESGSWFPPDWGSTLWIQTQASAGTVTPGFQAAQATVGVGGHVVTFVVTFGQGGGWFDQGGGFYTKKPRFLAVF